MMPAPENGLNPVITPSGIPLPPRKRRRKALGYPAIRPAAGRRTRFRRPPGRHVPLPAVLVALIVVLLWLWVQYMPNFTRVPVAPLPGGLYRLIVGADPIDGGAIVTADGGILLPFDVIRRFLDPHVFWDEPTKSVVVTTRDKVIRMGTETLTAYVNAKPVDLKMPVALLDEKPYVPMEVLLPIYGAGLSVHKESMTVILDTASRLSEAKWATVRDDRWPGRRGTVLREEPSIKGRIVADLEPQDTVLVFPEGSPFDDGDTAPGDATPYSPSEHPLSQRPTPLQDPVPTGWLKVRTTTGFLGYVRRTNLEIGRSLRLSELLPGLEDKAGAPTDAAGPAAVPPPASFTSGNPISLAWDYVNRYTPRYQPPEKGAGPFGRSSGGAGSTQPPKREWPSGINVVSPTWFSLSAGGGVNSLADAFYVMNAHSHGIEVWPLVSNAFDPDLTREALRSADSRQKIIAELLVLAELYGFDGYNLDFENVYFEDRTLLVQFVRELAPLAREQGLKVSVDVTVKSSSPNWSMCYDRKGLAQAADYIILMAYDQYPASSREAGPVAAIPWVERSIVRTLEEVPASQLVLGMPFYVRLWTEKKGSGGESKDSLSSKALSMERIDEILKAHGVEPEYDTNTGLPVARFPNEEGKNTVWLENDETVRTRIGLAKRYDLAGIAIWRMGFEADSTWEVVRREVAADTIAQSIEGSRPAF